MDLKEAESRIVKAIEIWKGKLLDLSKRNRALNFKVNPVSTVSIVDELPSNVFRLLCLEEKTLKFGPAADSTITPERRDSDEKSADLYGEEIENEADVVPEQSRKYNPYENLVFDSQRTETILQTNATREKLDKSLRRIHDQARTIVEEQGVNALFLSLGMLYYRESADSIVDFKAPLVLVPVEISRRSARDGYTIRISEDDVLVNPSLTEYLTRTHGFELPDIYSPESEYDFNGFIEEVNRAIAGVEGWKITNEIYLGLLSFQKLVMYKDLERNDKKIIENKICRQIINREGESFNDLPEQIKEAVLDEEFPPERTSQVVEADSSQVRAILTVDRNFDLVLEGPPGTGKSQTITNLIAQALASGKSVLFVAEKMAALEVVARRLSEVGLADFCLELHSSKANKKSVMQDIKRSLDNSLQRTAGTKTVSKELKAVRQGLTDYSRAVHAPFGALKWPPFRVYGEFEAVRFAPKFKFKASIDAVDEDKLKDVTNRIKELVDAIDQIGKPSAHPWRDSTKTYFSPLDLEAIEANGKSVKSLVTQIVEKSQPVCEILGLPLLNELSDLGRLLNVYSIISESPGISFEVLSSDVWNREPPETKDLIDLVRTTASTRDWIRERFKKEVFAYNPYSEIQFIELRLSGFFKFLAILDKTYRTIRRRWREIRSEGYEGSMLDQAIDLRKVVEYFAKLDEINLNEERAKELFGEHWKGEDSDSHLLEDFSKWITSFRRLLIDFGLQSSVLSTASQKKPVIEEVGRIKSLVERATGEIKAYEDKVGWPPGYLVHSTFQVVIERIKEIENNLSLSHDWTLYELARQRLSQTFAIEILEWLDSDEMSVSELEKAFRRAFFELWLSMAVAERQELKEFHTIAHESRLEQFRKLDQVLLMQNRTRLASALRKRVQDRLKESDLQSELQFLRRQLNRQRGLLPLRLTMKHSIGAISAIKPCFMMSPHTVAQLLDAEKTRFDLVIFDEASQLPTEDSIGSVIRGKQLVVVGDPKQLPPTNFFAVANGQVNVEKDEEGLPIIEDTQSILEEMLGNGIANCRLRWHYRSSDESLIAFSNAYFYDSDLYTFPSVQTDSLDRGIKFHFVANGIYEGKGLNLVEAREVVDSVVDHIKNSPDESLGVGTFNIRQQIAIQDEIEVRRRNDPSIEFFFNRDRHEPFFVKNLENIQGDERDVILLSVTYGRGPDGKIRYNLGPLNSENGWRRLNVLTTRAKKLLRVFSSIRSDDITMASTSSRGAELLKNYLRFAEFGHLDGPELTDRAKLESLFERQVFEELTNLGLKLVPQVGVSGYRIDLGVINLDLPGRFVCGIECDGVAYHSSETARDRDRLRQEVLEARGWDIHRIWSTDWFKDRKGQINRILRLVNGSLQKARDEEMMKAEARRALEKKAEEVAIASLGDLFSSSSGLEDVGQSGKTYVRPASEEYQIASLDHELAFRRILDTPTNVLASAIIHVVEIEAPIHITELFSRLASHWETSAGSRIRSRILQVVDLLHQANKLQVKDDFIWLTDGMVRVRSRSNMRVTADKIAPEEIAAAIQMILGNGHTFEKSVLINEVRSVFGFGRAGRTVAETIGRVIDDMQLKGKLGEGGAGIGLIR